MKKHRLHQLVYLKTEEGRLRELIEKGDMHYSDAHKTVKAELDYLQDYINNIDVLTRKIVYKVFVTKSGTFKNNDDKRKALERHIKKHPFNSFYCPDEVRIAKEIITTELNARAKLARKKVFKTFITSDKQELDRAISCLDDSRSRSIARYYLIDGESPSKFHRKVGLSSGKCIEKLRSYCS